MPTWAPRYVRYDLVSRFSRYRLVVFSRSHEDYGKHVTIDELTELVQPKLAVQRRFKHFLERHDIEYRFSRNRCVEFYV